MLKYDLSIVLSADFMPAGLTIEALGTSVGFGIEASDSVSGFAQCIACEREQRPADSAPLEFGIDKQRKNGSVAWVSGREPLDGAFFDVNPKGSIVDEPFAVGDRYAARVAEAIFPDGRTDFEDAL